MSVDMQEKDDRSDIIDRVLKDKLSGEYLPEGGLPGFDELFPQDKPVVPVRSSGGNVKRLSFARRWAVAASVLLVAMLSVSGYYFYSRMSVSVPLVASSEVAVEKSGAAGDMEVISDQGNMAAAIADNISESSVLQASALAESGYVYSGPGDEAFSGGRYEQEVPQVGYDRISVYAGAPVPSGLYADEDGLGGMAGVSVRTAVAEEKETGKERSGYREKRRLRKEARMSGEFDYDGEGSRERGISLSASGLASDFTSGQINGTVPSGTFQSPYVVMMDTQNKTMLANFMGDDFKHRFPISTAVGISYNFAGRFSVGTGISYSYLHSEAETQTKVRYSLSQDVHYVGIPLYFTYSFMTGRFVEPYVIAGARAEFVASAKTEVDVYAGSAFLDSRKDNVRYSGALFSLNAGAGVDFNFTDFFSLYVEPSVRYNVNSPEHPVTYLNSRDFNFELRLGVRFSF